MEDTQHKLRNAVQEVRGRCGGEGAGEPREVGGPFLPHPQVGPHRTCGTGVSAAFGNSRQQPPLRDPRRGRADAATKKPWPLPEAATSAFWAEGARKSPVLPPFSGGEAGGAGAGEGLSSASGAVFSSPVGFPAPPRTSAPLLRGPGRAVCGGSRCKGTLLPRCRLTGGKNAGRWSVWILK